MQSVPGKRKRERVLSNEQRAAGYYRLAYECAEAQKTGCNGYCGNCPLNVSLYEPNPRDAVLIKTSAAIDNQKMHNFKKQMDAEYLGALIAGIIILAIPLYFINSCCTAVGNFFNGSEKTVQETPRTQQYTVSNNNVSTNTNAVSESNNINNMAPKDTYRTYSMVDMVSLALCAHLSTRDVNGDGLINCIDYAVRFAEVCPEAHIIHNVNKRTGMDHLLNKVGAMYIEPQGQVNDLDPKVFWGSKYDPDMNMDETQYWKEMYARK
jgi:hypothetical protein